MRGNRPLAVVASWLLVFVLVWWVLFGFGVACVLFPPHQVLFPSPSMMTWALRPHGVRTRGKKMPKLGGAAKLVGNSFSGISHCSEQHSSKAL